MFIFGKSKEYVQAALHKASIDIMATWWRNFIKAERPELNDQRQKLDTDHIGSFQIMFHRIENVQAGFQKATKLAVNHFQIKNFDDIISKTRKS